MLNQFIAHAQQLIPGIEGRKVYVAVSGGVDSMVLLTLCSKAGLKPTALHCNFKLRGHESDEDEQFVKSFCESESIAFSSTEFKTDQIAKTTKTSIQECARNLRYQWFQTFLDKDEQAILLTAHHKNDSIETFFINLLRGTGLKGLIGIQSNRAQIFRPLLELTKEDLKNYAQQNKINFREDHSNSDLKYTRNHIRHQVLPLLQKDSPELISKMSTLMAELKATDDFLDQYVAAISSKLIKRNGAEKSMKINQFLALALPIKIRFLSQYDISRIQVSEIIQLCNGQTGSIFKNDHYTFLKNRDQILISNTAETSILLEKVANYPSNILIGNAQFKLSIVKNKDLHFTNLKAYLDADKITFPITITNQHKALKIQPLGMSGHKLVSDILIDAKLNRFEKENQMVFIHESDVIWVAGQTINHLYRITNDTKRVLKIEMLE